MDCEPTEREHGAERGDSFLVERWGDGGGHSKAALPTFVRSLVMLSKYLETALRG